MSGKNNASSTSDDSMTYQGAGVDIDAGNALVREIAPMAAATKRSGSMDGLGGFGGLFDLKACGYADPILVSATDGVGTKLKLAFETGIHDTVGIDLVAMCVNDVLVQGAEPLFFLDYFATGGLEVEQASNVIQGIADGCHQAGCQLIGGETAEMPGMYAKGEYDLAGFAVGAVERDGRLPRMDQLQTGDVLLGLVSSGLHSNGFSLVRKLAQTEGIGWNEAAPFEPGKTLGEACLTPTRIYVKSLLQLARSGDIKAMAHITGGGLLENIPRVLPSHLGCELDLASWQWPHVFDWIWQSGRIERDEMLRTFNCGIGMVVMVSADKAAQVARDLRTHVETVYTIGTLTKRQGQPVVCAGDWARG